MVKTQKWRNRERFRMSA